MLIKKRNIEVELEIIVLTYNNLKITKQFISLLYKNTSQKFGLIIVDNNSTDGTREYLEDLDYENLSLIFNDRNEGIVSGRNLGYKLSQESIGDVKYIVFLDNDQMCFKKGWLENHLEMMKKQDVDLIGVEAWQMKKDFYPFRKIKFINEKFSYVGCGGMMIKNEVIKNIGLFDERFFIYFEDPDFCFRCKEAGYRVGWNNLSVIDHQKHNLRLDGERRKYFMESWKKFREKWKNYKIPEFSCKVIQ